jgi:hypothetical protein
MTSSSTSKPKLGSRLRAKQVALVMAISSSAGLLVIFARCSSFLSSEIISSGLNVGEQEIWTPDITTSDMTYNKGD